MHRALHGTGSLSSLPRQQPGCPSTAGGVGPHGCFRHTSHQQDPAAGFAHLSLASRASIIRPSTAGGEGPRSHTLQSSPSGALETVIQTNEALAARPFPLTSRWRRAFPWCGAACADKGATLTLCEVGVEFTNHTVAVCMERTVPPADLLLIALIGKPVFRKVQARDHPLPCTVVTIQGTHSVTPEGHGGLTQTDWGVCLLTV